MGRENNAGFMYGVKEHDDSRVINSEYLEQNGLESAPQQLMRGYGYDFVYGVRATLDDYKRGMCSPRHQKKLGSFLATMKERGIDFGEPRFYLVVQGDYDVEDARWAFSDEIKNYSDLKWSSDSVDENSSSGGQAPATTRRRARNVRPRPTLQLMRASKLRRWPHTAFRVHATFFERSLAFNFQ